METETAVNLETEIIGNLKKVKQACRGLIKLSDEQIKAVLNDLADLTLEKMDSILQENKKDLERMDPENPKYDRLLLNEKRLQDIASDLRKVASFETPLHKILEERTLPNGLELSKVSVPLGVIGIIYESRPNVTFDVFSLCFKSGNACVLKGSRDAKDSNVTIVSLIHKVLEKHGVDKNIVYLAPSEREALPYILNAIDYIDIAIPRGSQGLIDFVRQNAKIPVIETGAGIVHTYFDETANIGKGKNIITNAKARRVSVCNALDTLVIHKSRLNDLPELLSDLGTKHQVEVFADTDAYKALNGNYNAELLHQATEEDFGIEFLSYKISVKTVNDLDEALDHIAKYSSRHSEAIVSESKENIENFLRNTDAAVVYANTSTAFTDGGQFGLGAEIGISTQKLHARGPMALNELTSYKWVIRGEGQVRD